jgi:hypothetical protein
MYIQEKCKSIYAYLCVYMCKSKCKSVDKVSNKVLIMCIYHKNIVEIKIYSSIYIIIFFLFIEYFIKLNISCFPILSFFIIYKMHEK